MKKVILLLLSVASVFVYAQQPTSNLSISLKQAIDEGLKNRYDIQAQKYNLAVADNSISKTKKEWIPEISGSATARYSPQIQATYIPAGFISPNPALVALGATSISVFGLDLNQNIFKPAITTDVKIAKNNLAQQQEKNKQDENTIKEEIVKSYLNVLLKDLQNKIAANDEQRYKEYAQVAEGKLKLGTLIENDYLKAKLDYENAKSETLKAKQSYDLAVNNIRYQINIPAETQLSLTDSLNSLFAASDQLATKGDANNRTEIKQLVLQQEANKLYISKTRQNALPTFSFFANYSQQFTYTNFDYGLHQWWSPFNYLGLKLSVPITSNFKNYNSIQEYKFKSTQTDLELKQRTSDINYEIQKASTELSNSYKNMQTAKSNYELSQVIYQNQKQQYTIGSLLYSNLLDTDRTLSTTEQNYIKAVYDYLLANVNYQKAIGNI
ncbi:MAG TPA: TolC family protein [Bacteroidia bacterium]|nr:TolC family protein [Bacteroidia bacterium]